MKKIDKLVFGAFLGVFVLTFCVGLFIILMQLFLFKLDILIGKGLGWGIYLQLSSYFAIIASKQAFPLAILLASVMAMGNLGEHCELTALKSAGISLPRVLFSLAVFVFLLSVLALFSNSYLVPRANLNALNLLDDLGKKKPSLAIKEGAFYDDIPGYSIKIRKQLEDQKSLQGIMVYDHTQERGNVSLTMAESGKLYTIHNEAYLVLELFDGHSYIEDYSQDSVPEATKEVISPLYRSGFKTQKLILSLDSFKLSRTKKEAFENNTKTKSASRLAAESRSIKKRIVASGQALQAAAVSNVTDRDSTAPVSAASIPEPLPAVNVLALKAYAEQQQVQEVEGGTVKSPLPQYQPEDMEAICSRALGQTWMLRDKIALQIREEKRLEGAIRNYDLERHQMMAWAAACLVVFLVGAPLGAIIKKGGLGFPVLIAIALMVWHYIFEMLGEKWAYTGVVSPFIGAWLANMMLLPFGIFFLIQAYRDARLLEADFYAVLLGRLRKQIGRPLGLFRRDTRLLRGQ